MDSLTKLNYLTARKTALFLAGMSQNYLAARNQAHFLAVLSVRQHISRTWKPVKKCLRLPSLQDSQSATEWR